MALFKESNPLRFSFLISVITLFVVLDSPAQDKIADSLKIEFSKIDLEKEQVKGLETMQNLAMRYFQINEKDSMLHYANYLNELALHYNNPNAIFTANNILGRIYFARQMDFERGLTFFLKALQVAQDNKDSLRITAGYGNIAVVYKNMEEYDSALVYNQRALYIDSLRGNKLNQFLGQLNLVNTYLHLGLIKKGLKGSKAALKIAKEIGTEDDLSYCYKTIAILYIREGSYQLSLEYLDKARALLPQENKLGLANLFKSYSRCYGNMDMYSEAFNYAMGAAEINEQIYGAKHPKLYASYLSLAQIQNKNKKFIEAQDFVEKAKICARNQRKENQVWNRTLTEMQARIEANREKYDAALIYYDSVISYEDQNKRSVYVTFHDIGDVYKAKNELESSLKYYNKSINTLSKSTDINNMLDQPQSKALLNTYYALTPLFGKAEALEQLYQQRNDLLTLTAAFRHYQLLDTLIDEVRKSHLEQQDQVKFGEKMANIYAGGIRVAQKLFIQTNDTDLIDQVFLWSEKSKAIALSESLANYRAKSFGNIPDSLLEAENDLRTKISFYENKIFSQESKGDQSDKMKLADYSEKLFEFKRRHESLMGKFETDFPDYHRLKYEKNQLSLKEVQGRLEGKSALLEYFVADKSIYALLIKKDTVIFNQLPKEETILLVRRLREKLVLNISNKDSETSFNDFLNTSNTLYSHIFSSWLDMDLLKSIEKMTIIPDDELNYLPFDLLVTDKPNLAEGFKSISYMVKKFNISYAYSANLLFKDRYAKEKADKNLISFAPTYGPVGQNSDLTIERSGRFRNAMVPLEWNDKEITSISDYVENETYTANRATEANFKKTVNDYNIIHMAMHAFVDDEDPMYSKLVFTQDKDSVEDGFLHTFELYNMELKAEMAVLSACETGYGRLVKGEGLMSLARAFSYAGVPSIVMSHWKVNDVSTARLMELFYQNLSEGMTKSAALRKAKLTFLESADPIFQHPYYWSAFVVVGDDSPIVENNYNWIYLIVIAGLLLIVPALWLRFKK